MGNDRRNFIRKAAFGAAAIGLIRNFELTYLRFLAKKKGSSTTAL